MNRLKQHIILSFSVLLYFWSSGVSFGQNITNFGRYKSHYYSVNDYDGSAQIWTGIQHRDGRMIFGATQDLICFNGVEWSKIFTKESKKEAELMQEVNTSKVCKLFKASDERVYVGRRDNIGYIDYNKLGNLEYFPLFINREEKKIGDVWNIFEVSKDEILFFARTCILSYKNKSVKKLPVLKGFEGFVSTTSARFGNGILAVYSNENDQIKYLYYDILLGTQREISVPEQIRLNNIRGSFEINGDWIVLDNKNGFFKAKFINNEFIWAKNNTDLFPQLNGIAPNYIVRSKNQLLFGTELKGLIISDLSGNIIRTIDANDELENNYVFSFFLDRENNIWLCLDNGIQNFETGSPLTYFSKKEGVSEITEAIDFTKDYSLFGMHTDVFTTKTTDYHTFFTPTRTVQSTIFDLQTFKTQFGNKTLVVGSDSLYEYIPSTSRKKAIAQAYAYCFSQDKLNPNIIYVTLENGIGKLTLSASGKWDFKFLVTNLDGGTYSIATKGEHVYFGINGIGVGIYHSGTGKFQIIKEKKRSKKTPSSNIGEANFFVENFQNEIYVGTTDGISTISSNFKSFVPCSFNSTYFKSENNIHRLINIDDKFLIVVNYIKKNKSASDFITGSLTKNGNNWSFNKRAFAELKKVGLIYSISKDFSNNLWVGTNNGLYVLNMSVLGNLNESISVSFDRLEINERIFRYNLKETSQIGELKYANNTLKFVFHANSFSQLNDIEYRYKLDGFNDYWSDYTKLNFASFEKLPEGTYTLMVQARSPYTTKSKTLKYIFTILPPWYRTTWAFIVYFILMVFIIYLVVLASTQRVKRQNQRLEEIVQERTKEIAEQNHQLELQKEEITQKTTDILDSIHYAKRIQNTILPATTRLNELFDEHFVFYRPKDIVSGDFYWAREVQGKMIFSAIDCTGHGVPGALVSIVGNNGLIRAVNEFKLTEPNEILDKLREIVINAFKSDGQVDVKDGMDIALCSIDYTTGELKFAGANNECVIIRNGEIIELKPDKQPIGQYINPKPFTQQTFQLQENDCIYLYTDGYVDQFGGERLKKFKSRPFKVLLSELGNTTMSEQYTIIRRTFDTWKDDLEQVDDVCVFGVKFKGIRS